MDIGTKVKVVAVITGHEFNIGEVVTRVVGTYDGEYDSLAFESKHNGVWYMKPDEYVVIEQEEVDTVNIPRELAERLAYPLPDQVGWKTYNVADHIRASEELRALLNKDT